MVSGEAKPMRMVVKLLRTLFSFLKVMFDVLLMICVEMQGAG
jgi:hypothetical protein